VCGYLLSPGGGTPDGRRNLRGRFAGGRERGDDERVASFPGGPTGGPRWPVSGATFFLYDFIWFPVGGLERARGRLSGLGFPRRGAALDFWARAGAGRAKRFSKKKKKGGDGTFVFLFFFSQVVRTTTLIGEEESAARDGISKGGGRGGGGWGGGPAGICFFALGAPGLSHHPGTVLPRGRGGRGGGPRGKFRPSGDKRRRTLKRNEEHGSFGLLLVYRFGLGEHLFGGGFGKGGRFGKKQLGRILTGGHFDF